MLLVSVPHHKWQLKKNYYGTSIIGRVKLFSFDTLHVLTFPLYFVKNKIHYLINFLIIFSYIFSDIWFLSDSINLHFNYISLSFQWKYSFILPFFQGKYYRRCCFQCTVPRFICSLLLKFCKDFLCF